MARLWTNGLLLGAVVLLTILAEFALSFIVAQLRMQSTFRLAALWAVVQPGISFFLILSTAKHVGIINILIGWACTFATLTAFNMVVFSVGRQDTSTTINGIPLFATAEGFATLSIFPAVLKLLHWNYQRETSLSTECEAGAVALYDRVAPCFTLQNVFIVVMGAIFWWTLPWMFADTIDTPFMVVYEDHPLAPEYWHMMRRL